MLTVPDAVPEAVGVNVTLIVQLDPDGNLPPTGQLFVSAKSALAVMLLIARAWLEGLDKVTDCGALVVSM
jgi:hypothetical protein